ncbi:MAG: hypothetical protein IT337_07575, partial [Thermomicrobiales bacterium]|nr:hypothetical protein [Thermomicrobiales bacterium]
AMGGLLAALAATGWAAAPTPAPIDLTRSWGDARAAGSENILWNGDVSAPAHPWGEPRACQAWLSTRSLFWSPRDGAGLCRLPLAALLDGAPATANDRAPLLVVGYRDPGGSRHDLILCFDRHASPDRNQRERGALLVGLRSRGVSLGAPLPPSRPWEPAPSGDEPHGDGVADVATEPRAGSWRALPSAPHVPAAEARTTLMHSRDCEAALLGELARVSAALAAPVGVAVGRDDAPPLGAALAELDGAATGGMPADEIARRRARLLALSEAATRLRGLLVLRDGGLVAGAALDQRRRAILQPLERHLCA